MPCPYEEIEISQLRWPTADGWAGAIFVRRLRFDVPPFFVAPASRRLPLRLAKQERRAKRLKIRGPAGENRSRGGKGRRDAGATKEA
jgi:hypothetical protein